MKSMKGKKTKISSLAWHLFLPEAQERKQVSYGDLLGNVDIFFLFGSTRVTSHSYLTLSSGVLS